MRRGRRYHSACQGAADPAHGAVAKGDDAGSSRGALCEHRGCLRELGPSPGVSHASRSPFAVLNRAKFSSFGEPSSARHGSLSQSQQKLAGRAKSGPSYLTAPFLLWGSCFSAPECNRAVGLAPDPGSSRRETHSIRRLGWAAPCCWAYRSLPVVPEERHPPFLLRRLPAQRHCHHTMPYLTAPSPAHPACRRPVPQPPPAPGGTGMAMALQQSPAHCFGVLGRSAPRHLAPAPQP